MKRDGDRPAVLIVDDVPANLVALEAQLSKLDCDVVRAGSGNQALAQLLKREFAVVLLDVQMPDINGFEVARYAREHPATRDVPLIFLTAMDESEENMLRGYGAGAIDFLFKPINAHILRGKVRIFLELHLSRRRLADEIDAHRQTVAELRASEAQARELAARAERESQFKSRFLASMSHELRTPLNAIIGFSELLERELFGPLNVRQMDYVGNVLQSGRHLLSLVNDVLDLAKIEAGRVMLQRVWTNPALVVEAVQSGAQTLADRCGVQIDFDVPRDVPDLHVDPLRMKQILYNLLSNAIKFTPNGGSVHMRLSADAGHVDLIVEDTGIGIAEDDLPRLFREFEQIESGTGAKPEGTGLGLAVSKRLVEMHGGQILVGSTLGKGSTFTVRLPTSRAAPGVMDAAAPGADSPMILVAGLRVLVVGDEGDVAGAEETLRRAGCAVTRATEVSDALLGQLGAFDVVLVDLSPDPTAATRILEATGKGQAAIPVIGLMDESAAPDEAWRSRVQQIARADALQPDRLVTAVRNAVRRRPPGEH